MPKFARTLFAVLLVVLTSSPVTTQASVTYLFEFSDLWPSVPPSPDFSISLTYDDYVTTLGFENVVGPALPTSLGYSISRVGAGVYGMWGFDVEGGTAILRTSGFHYDLTSFLFMPDVFNLDNFYQAPGVFPGDISGNAHGGIFGGRALLTIADDSVEVPEPDVRWLVALALAAVASLHHKRRTFRAF
ncbi:hypothetical protein [Niveibacterium sp. SC-1]|uniref:hypothetical protein n=1 Tax=Niveibacterium sp. SC-1 TaxID=3135646 RepID=UPI00311EF891